MKHIISKGLTLMAITSLTLFTTSCSDDDNGNNTNNSIQIELTEVGHGTPPHVHAGEDLHLEAEILAPGKIASVTVEIHNESDTSAPEITASFDDYNGLLNATFHKHIDIPANQPPGNYHLHLTVTDQNGNVKMVEAELEILAADTENNIEIELTEIGHGTIDNAHAHAGEDLHIDGHIHSTHAVVSIEIEIHHETNASAPEITATYTNYAGQTDIDFHEHIEIPANQPTGDYHFHITVTDDEGNTKTAEYELTIE